MSAENLAYALVQLVHNFGAAAVVGGAVFARWPAVQPCEVRRALAWLVLAAWIAQVASGISFAAVSRHFYGALPDIHAVARAALAVKVAAAVLGLATTLWLLRRDAGPGNAVPGDAVPGDAGHARAWRMLAACGVIALAAAAVLRWYS